MIGGALFSLSIVTPPVSWGSLFHDRGFFSPPFFLLRLFCLLAGHAPRRLSLFNNRWANFAAHRAADSAGNEEFLTPNLAALAKNGTLLDRMYGCVCASTMRLPAHQLFHLRVSSLTHMPCHQQAQILWAV